ncbi:MAG: signal peptidase I [Steroidobacteraceae bacterium]
MSERLDFSLVLIIVVLVSGVVWGLDRLFLEGARARAAAAAGQPASSQPLPVTVDYARSFFPVALIVLLVRSFIFEPFRIPSDSMMPTLLDGDFIVVNKYAYGLRLPILGTRLAGSGEPQRGDVVVFRYPPDPAVNYIKRVVGLPGDKVQVINDQLIINGQPIPLTEDASRYDDGCYHNMRQSTELIGAHTHRVLSCRSPEALAAPVTSSCKRQLERNYQCEESGLSDIPDSGDTAVIEVPAGHYLMIGDNRDNSSDGRYFGFVPENYLIGKATRIWFNWDLQRAGGPIWSRIGHAIE